MAKKVETVEITVLEISQGRANFGVLGTSPLIFNCVSEKARRELLMPKPRRTSAERAQSLKHVPILEYRNSVYRNLGDGRPTRLCFPAPAFKQAMAAAALDLPGTRKSEISRLCWVEGVSVDIWGIPQVLMSVVRSADMNRTPDIRTRAILPRWCAMVSISFVRPKLQVATVERLMAAAGITIGIGDFRQQKGAGSFGQFRLADAKDAEFKAIQKEGGRVAQDAALEEPECYDAATEELFSWSTAEIIKLQSHREPEIEDEADETDAA